MYCHPIKGDPQRIMGVFALISLRKSRNYQIHCTSPTPLLVFPIQSSLVIWTELNIHAHAWGIECNASHPRETSRCRIRLRAISRRRMHCCPYVLLETGYYMSFQIYLFWMFVLRRPKPAGRPNNRWTHAQPFWGRLQRLQLNELLGNMKPQ